MTEEIIRADAPLKTNRSTPGISEFLMAMKIIVPLAAKQAKDPDFDANAALTSAIKTAHRCAQAAIDDFQPNRYIIGRMTDALIPLGDKLDDDALVEAITKIFSQPDEKLNAMIADLANVVSSRYATSMTQEEMVRVALLRHSGPLIADIMHFSFWCDPTEVAKEMMTIIGDISLRLAKEIDDLSSQRSLELTVGALVARTAEVVRQCYRKTANECIASMRDKPLEEKIKMRDNTIQTFVQTIAKDSEATMRIAMESARAFCFTDICRISNQPGV